MKPKNRKKKQRKKKQNRLHQWLVHHHHPLIVHRTREELTTILVPEDVLSSNHNVAVPGIEWKENLIEYGGKIAIFEHSYLKDGGVATLWVLEDVKEKEWLNQTLSLQPCQMHLVQDTEVVVKGTTPDSKVILAPYEMCSRFYILCYDLQSNDLRKVEIKGVLHFWFDKECYADLRFMDESESFIYFGNLTTTF
ncbi:F-box/LRR-repeat protein At2g40920-like [Eutrema salsugineum]|uniref:F-box/LRR-repeat protein At2g40920-like n=1 Tax=Eutrema salsugineum TaxID=72664 RepID=UPI000CED3391|nr:F-box/LRR-repeat protein At2g40920-like [Eutrema salsugineum]